MDHFDDAKEYKCFEFINNIYEDETRIKPLA